MDKGKAGGVEGRSEALLPSSYHYPDYSFRFILIGDSGCGKTTLLRRFTDKRAKWDTTHVPTIGVDFDTRTLFVEASSDAAAHTKDKKLVKVKLQLWDCAGQPCFRQVTSTFYRNCTGIILVYDVTNPESLENVADIWYPDAIQMAPDGVKMVLIGNKADLLASKGEGQAGAGTASLGSSASSTLPANIAHLPHVLASAYTGKGVDEAFQQLVVNVLNDPQVDCFGKLGIVDRTGGATSPTSIASRVTVSIDDNDEEENGNEQSRGQRVVGRRRQAKCCN